MNTGEPGRVRRSQQSWMRLAFDSRYDALLTLCWVFLVLALFLAPVPLTQDGPSRFYGAQTLNQLLRHSPGFQEHFVYNSILVPNWLGTILLAALGSVMTGKTAIAAMMTLVAAGMLAGLYYCTAGLDESKWAPHQRSQVLLILTPLAIGVFLTYGFWGFLISSTLCLFVVGKSLRGGSEGNFKRQVLIAAALLLAYWAHGLPVVWSGMFQVCLFGNELWQATNGEKVTWKKTLKKIANAFWPWLLPAGLVLWFVVRLTSPEATKVAPHEISQMVEIRNRLVYFVPVRSLVEMSPTESSGGVFALLLGVLVAGALLRRGERYIPVRSIATFALVLLTTYFLVPDSVGNGSEIAIRTLFTLVIFVAVLALRPGRMEASSLTLCTILATVCVLTFGVEYLLVSRRLSPAVEELRMAMGGIPQDSKVVLLTYRLTPRCARWPLEVRAMEGGQMPFLLAADRKLIVLNHYEPTSADFPVLYRGTSFSSLLNDQNLKGRDSWDAAVQKLSGLDYIVSWGIPSQARSCKDWATPAPYQNSLPKNYALLDRKTGVSLVELWKPK